MILASRLALSASLIWFALASVLGLLMGLDLIPHAWRTAHAHMQLLGFLSMMVYGVAYHALPRFRGVPFRRPGVALAQVAVANAGLLGMALGWGLDWPEYVWGLFSGLELLAIFTFVALMLEVLWTRPKSAATFRGPR